MICQYVNCLEPKHGKCLKLCILNRQNLKKVNEEKVTERSSSSSTCFSINLDISGISMLSVALAAKKKRFNFVPNMIYAEKFNFHFKRVFSVFIFSPASILAARLLPAKPVPYSISLMIIVAL